MKYKIAFLFFILSFKLFSDNEKIILYPMESMMTPDIHRFDFRVVNSYEKNKNFEQSDISYDLLLKALEYDQEIVDFIIDSPD